MHQLLASRAVQPVLVTLGLLPLASLMWGVWAQTLGANPAETLIRSTGDWTLRLLCATLAVTPLRQLSGWHGLARWRRTLGLLTFFYALLHFAAYGWLDMGLDPQALLLDLVRRPFILAGSLALLVLTALAATSFNRAIRALGARRWQQLHRAVYAAALAALVHFFWMRAGKNDFGEVLLYAAVLALLLGWRAWRWRAGRVAVAPRGATSAPAADARSKTLRVRSPP